MAAGGLAAGSDAGTARATAAAATRTPRALGAVCVPPLPRRSRRRATAPACVAKVQRWGELLGGKEREGWRSRWVASAAVGAGGRLRRRELAGAEDLYSGDPSTSTVGKSVGDEGTTGKGQGAQRADELDKSSTAASDEIDGGQPSSLPAKNDLGEALAASVAVASIGAFLFGYHRYAAPNPTFLMCVCVLCARSACATAGWRAHALQRNATGCAVGRVVALPSVSGPADRRSSTGASVTLEPRPSGAL